jgi:hypothetical protein
MTWNLDERVRSAMISDSLDVLGIRNNAMDISVRALRPGMRVVGFQPAVNASLHSGASSSQLLPKVEVQLVLLPMAHCGIPNRLWGLVSQLSAKHLVPTITKVGCV